MQIQKSKWRHPANVQRLVESDTDSVLIIRYRHTHTHTPSQNCPTALSGCQGAPTNTQHLRQRTLFSPVLHFSRPLYLATMGRKPLAGCRPSPKSVILSIPEQYPLGLERRSTAEDLNKNTCIFFTVHPIPHPKQKRGFSPAPPLEYKKYQVRRKAEKRGWREGGGGR